MLHVKNITKKFKMGSNDIQILNGVDFNFEKGKFYVILGASGSGKSTFLNCISTIDKPTTGEITFNGDSIGSLTSTKQNDLRKNDFGFIFQQYNLINDVSVRVNVDLGANSNNSEKSFTTEQVLEDVGLIDKINSRPNQLSGGQQQRVAIARAIVKNPDILFCDEPTGALDEKSGKDVIKLLQNLNKKYNTTLIMITHSNAISLVADTVIKLRDGKIDKVIENKTKPNIDDLEW